MNDSIYNVRGWSFAESIEWFTEVQAFSPSYDLAHSLPPFPSANYLSFSVVMCVARRAYWRERGERGGGVKKPTIRRQESLVLCSTLTTLRFLVYVEKACWCCVASKHEPERPRVRRHWPAAGAPHCRHHTHHHPYTHHHPLPQLLPHLQVTEYTELDRQTERERERARSLRKKKIKFSSNISKFRMEQLQSHLWLRTASGEIFAHFLIY